MNKFILYYHTLKYLKFKQFFYRLWYKFYQPKISLNMDNVKIREKCKETQFLAKAQTYFSTQEANFLNHSVNIESKQIWDDQTQEKLWLYNLHYFDALSASNAQQRKLAYALLQRWVIENPVDKKGNAWEPYPISLRIVNIIKYALSSNILDNNIENSLYIQACFLNKTCEYHLLGNHLFENYKALCFAGMYFKGKEAKKWFNKGFNGLKKEIVEQVLDDGGHFELSPMYHCIILEGLLELQALFIVYDREKLFPWTKEIENMLAWLWQMMRNEGSISYFNDAADGIAHKPKEIFDFARSLGYEVNFNAEVLTQLGDSGYIVAQYENAKVIFDVAKVGPDYLPGHAHADTLSFELIVDKHPVFVNLGTSCYGFSERRKFERATQAHNTVYVSNEDSSEVWLGFRVARRAIPRLIDINQADGSYIIEVEHNGYKRLDKKLIHKRRLKVSDTSLQINDSISLSNHESVGYLHLHPGCKLLNTQSDKVVILLPNEKQVAVEIDCDYSILTSQYAQMFGQLRETKSICYKLKTNESNAAQIKVSW